MIRLVDLSLDICDRTPTFWPDPKTAVIPHLRIENLKYNITQLVMSTHLGTHLDAPFHFFDDGRTVDQLDLSKGFGPAHVLDFTNKCPDGTITREDLQQHVERIGEGARIIIKTGWDKQFPDDRYFAEGPGVSPDACNYLVEQKAACLALDMPTVLAADYVDVHRALLRAEVLIIEGLANLDTLENDHVLLVALPLRIKGRDGSPIRAIAVDGLTKEQMAPFDVTARESQ